MIKVQVANAEDKRKEGPELQFGNVYHRSSIALVYRFDTMMVEGVKMDEVNIAITWTELSQKTSNFLRFL